ncbi:hypothetical protein PVAP13_6NG335200 [Panicum virgatum]|uniref:Uncharacterized protein n=1 Tax=Panicum virgatum TaxID=38727 RepID=A0A8T0R3Z6_PANVG|nr:hypothetical protein PVAP13_6NG335200 [Panicum virgatum]
MRPTVACWEPAAAAAAPPARRPRGGRSGPSPPCAAARRCSWTPRSAPRRRAPSRRPAPGSTSTCRRRSPPRCRPPPRRRRSGSMNTAAGRPAVNQILVAEHKQQQQLPAPGAVLQLPGLMVPPVMAVEQPVKRGYHGILTVIREEESRLKEQTKAIRQMARLELCYS